MYPSLKGKVAIVTGAAGMVGAGIAKRFALEGTRVAAVDVDHDGVRRAAEEISSDTGGDVRPYGADISSRGDVRRTVEEVVGRWSRVDILVNNAGVLRADFIEDLREAIPTIKTSVDTYVPSEEAIIRTLPRISLISGK